MSLSDNRHTAMLPLKTRLYDDGELQIPALSENERAVRIVQTYHHLETGAQAGAGMGREIASRANAGQAARGQRGALATRPYPGGPGPRGHEVSAPGGDVGRSSGSPVAAAWSKPWRIIAGAHRPPPPGQRWKSNEPVQKELKVGNLEDELGPPPETPARWEEFMKRWPGQWRLMVSRFAEKRVEQDDGDERGGLSGSSGGEFLCPDCGDDFPTLRRLKCNRGTAHGVRRPAARFVRDGVCPHCHVNFHCRARALAHLERGARGCREAELNEADLEMVRYRRQARVEGLTLTLASWRCRPDVRCGLENIFPSECMVVVDSM